MQSGKDLHQVTVIYVNLYGRLSYLNLYDTEEKGEGEKKKRGIRRGKVVGLEK